MISIPLLFIFLFCELKITPQDLVSVMLIYCRSCVQKAKMVSTKDVLLRLLLMLFKSMEDCYLLKT